jgi:transposase
MAVGVVRRTERGNRVRALLFSHDMRLFVRTRRLAALRGQRTHQATKLEAAQERLANQEARRQERHEAHQPGRRSWGASHADIH